MVKIQNKKNTVDINYIIHKSLNGDKHYQEILLKKLHPLIYKNIYQYCSPKDNSVEEDMVQEGYIVILESLKTFNKNLNVHFLGYVKSKLYYFYKNYYRNNKKYKNVLSLNKELKENEENLQLLNILENKYDLLENVITNDFKNKLKSSIKKLNKKEQDIIYMYYYNEISLKEISDKLNIPYRTVISSKYIAIKKLKNFIFS